MSEQRKRKNVAQAGSGENYTSARSGLKMFFLGLRKNDLNICVHCGEAKRILFSRMKRMRRRKIIFKISCFPKYFPMKQICMEILSPIDIKHSPISYIVAVRLRSLIYSLLVVYVAMEKCFNVSLWSFSEANRKTFVVKNSTHIFRRCW